MSFLAFLFCSVSLPFLQEISFAAAVNALTSQDSIVYGQELISSGDTFVLGFFNPGGSSRNYYLGIWYKGIVPTTIVWVANGQRPLNDTNGLVRFSSDGNLVLLDGAGNTKWSTTSSGAIIKEPTVKLLDSGNLVVMNGEKDIDSESDDDYIWQSFDYPSHTLLPEMKLGWDKETGLNRFLSSWKASDDPSVGNYTYGVDLVGLPQLVIKEGSNHKYRTGIWTGVGFNTFPIKITGAVSSEFTLTDNQVLYWNLNTTSITRLVLNEKGIVQRYIWDNIDQVWNLMYEAIKDRCDNYGLCGVNGICNINDMPVYCSCLKGFIPKSQQEWDAFNWGSGCIRRTPLNCTDSDEFRTLGKVKLPNLVQFWINHDLTLKECKVECLKNCSCTAYSNSGLDGGPHGCLLWYGDLLDIRLLKDSSHDGLDLYLRLAASDIDSTPNARGRREKIIVVVTISVALGASVLGCILYLVFKKKKVQKTVQAGNENQNDSPFFDAITILASTDNFSDRNKIGEGGFGPVYKGVLDGQEIAVKRLSTESRQGTSEFMNEVRLVAKLQHRNLVKLLGGCTKGEERMLVYEYMPHKSLDRFIFDPRKATVLNWRTRCNIIMGIARGLLYLHQDSRLTIIHRDLKTSNILLDGEFIPKISDFGMAYIFEGHHSIARTRTIAGTCGYMSPEYAMNGILSVKSDVFSFGVIVLEILSGLRNIYFKHPVHNHNLLGHAWILWKEGQPLEFMDVHLEHSYASSELLRCMQVGLLCVQNFPEYRPTMFSVVSMLGNESLTLPQPKKPGYFKENLHDTWSDQKESYSGNCMTITLLEARD